MTTGSVHSRRSSVDLLLAAARRGRGTSMPSASYSTAFQPMPDAEAEASAGQHVDLGGLLGDERGLALGQDDDAGDQLEAGVIAAR